MNLSCRMCLATLLAGAALQAWPAQRIGWVVPPEFHEAPSTRTESARQFYLKDEGPQHWTERATIAQTTLPGDMSFEVWLDRQHAAAKSTCPHMLISVAGPSRIDDTRIESEMWQCGDDTVTNRAAVSIRRYIVDGDVVYSLVAESDYPPVPPGKTPVLREQVARWGAFSSSFTPCANAAHPGCLRDPNELVHARPAPLSPERAAQVKKIEARGKAMYRQDQLAWHSTDVLRKRGLPLPTGKGGFLALPGTGRAGKFYLIQDTGSGYAIRYVVTTKADGSHAVTEGKAADLTPQLAMRFRAAQTALHAKASVCTQHVNTIVLPTEDKQGWWVYVMSASRDKPRIWIGGNTRDRVSRDGSRILTTFASARSCVEFDVGEPRPAFLAMTHLVSDLPTEFHVMQSLTWHQPMLVATRTGIWKVEGGRTTLLKLPAGIH